jgi:DivIVA domain-containing protein
MSAANEQFRQVLRGYDPAEVDRRLHELVANEQAARAHIEQLTARLQQVEQAHRDAVQSADEARAAATPSYEDLGSRIGQILSLADEEATELRNAAKDAADELHHDAHQAAEQLKTDADRYAAKRRGDADTEAESILKQARRQADEMIDGADRDAAARRQEAEAVYETQRAKAAAAAADFEMTLAQRRENAEAEFTQQLSASNEQLSVMEHRVETVKNEADKMHADAEMQARRLIEDAEKQAAETIAQSRAHAERIRAESDRELAAATQRRDSINAQLSNVRQMLATLSGAAPSGLLFSVGDGDAEADAADPSSLAASPAEPGVDADDTDEVDESQVAEAEAADEELTDDDATDEDVPEKA